MLCIIHYDNSIDILQGNMDANDSIVSALRLKALW